MMRGAAILSILLFSGCEVSVDAFCDAQVRAHCERSQRCGLVSRAVDCTKRGAQSDCLAAYRNGLRAGVLNYDGAEAHRCIDAIRTSGCGNVRTPQACVDMVAGSAQEGAQCGGCAKGLRCEHEGAMCGVCRLPPAPPPVVGAGETCVSAGATGATCAEGLSCYSARCVEPKPLGASCASGVCARGLWCSGELTCTRVPDVGEECTDQGLCLGGLKCIGGRCTLLVENGGSCQSALQCQSDSCVDGVCQGRRAAGESCDDRLFCADGLECVAGVCVGLPVDGEACPRARCASTARCVDGTCRDPLVQCR